jgi:hypothetical protein
VMQGVAKLGSWLQRCHLFFPSSWPSLRLATFPAMATERCSFSFLELSRPALFLPTACRRRSFLHCADWRQTQVRLYFGEKMGRRKVVTRANISFNADALRRPAASRLGAASRRSTLR